MGFSGSGGMGKSTLAFRFADSYKHEFPDGVIGLPVEGKTIREIACDFARVIARHNGEKFDEEDERSPATIMQEVFAYRRVLLIFDNVSPVGHEDGEDLRDLLPGGQRCALIVTTRDRQVLNAFEIPKNGIIDLQPLSQNDAAKFLRHPEVLGADRVNAESDAVDRIIQIIDGLPLALQIISSTLRGRQRNLADYAASLQEEKTRLRRLRDPSNSNPNVTASLNLSFRLLNDAEINLFACLSVCAKDGFSRKTAMVTGGLADKWETQELLDRLYQLSLLNEVSADRYVFHTLVRDYAGDRARERDLWETAAQRHAEYFIDLVQSNDVESPEIADQLAENFNDVLQAAQWLRENTISEDQKEAAYQFALTLRPFLLKYSYSKQAIELMMGVQAWAEQLNDWYASVRFKIQHAKYLAIEGQLSEAEVILESAQDSIERISDPIQRQESQLKQLNSLGGVLRKQRDFEKAIATFEREITIAEASNDQEQVAIGLHGLGMVFLERGDLSDLDAAIAAFERSIAIAETLDDQTSLAISLNRLGRLLEQQEKFEDAIAAFERSTAIAETLNDKTSLAISLNCLGGALQKQGRLKESLVTFERLITISEATNDQKRLAVTLNRLGGIFQKQNDLESAITTFNREISIDRELGDQRQLVFGLNCLGRVLQRRRNLDEAIATFKEQIEVAEALNDQKQVAIGWGCLGDVYHEQRNFDEAIVAFQHEIRVEEAFDNQQQLVFAYNQLGEVFREKGDLEAAIITFKRGISLAESLKDSQKHLAVGLHCLGKALGEKGDWEAMIVAFLRSIFIGEALNDKGQAIIGYTFLERALQEQHDKKRLILSLKNKLFASQDLNEKKQLAAILSRLGKILQNQSNYEDAIFAFQQSVDIAESLSNYELLINSLKQLGGLFSQQDRSLEAITVLEYEIRIYEEANDQQQLTVALNRLGGLLQHQRKFEEAINVFQREISIDRELGDQRQLVIGLNCLGRALQRQGRFDEAIDTFKEQIEVAEALNDQKAVATGWGCLGEVYKQQRNFDDAIIAFQREISIEDALGNQQQLTVAYNRLGEVFKDSDHLEYSAAAFNQSIEISKKLNDKMNWAIGLDCLGGVLRRQRKLKEAAITFKEEIKIAEEIFNIRQLAIGWNSLGEVTKEQGCLEESVFAFLHAATYNESLEDEKQLHSIWKRLENVLRNKSNMEAVNTALQHFNLIVNELETSLHKAVALHSLGKAYKTINKLEEAEIILRESQEWLDGTNNIRKLLKVLKTLEETFEKKQDWEQAERFLHLSYNEVEKLRDISLQEKIVRKLGEICMKQETEEKIMYAKSCFQYSVKLSLEMNDSFRLAQVYKAWGDALRHNEKLEDSVFVLVEGFEKLISDIEIHVHKSGKHIDSLRMTTEALGYTLISLNRRGEALKYCDRAIAATNNAPQLVELRNKLLNRRAVVKLQDRLS